MMCPLRLQFTPGYHRYAASDVRFTIQGNALYAIQPGLPDD